MLAALAQLNKPVLWAHKGPGVFDCSGLVTHCLRECGGPDWRGTHNSQRLFDELQAPDVPMPGDLVFWRPRGKFAGRVEHVAILLPGGAVLTADGATPRITTLEAARAAGARVCVRSSTQYRQQLAGFRRLP